MISWNTEKTKKANEPTVQQYATRWDDMNYQISHLHGTILELWAMISAYIIQL